MIGALAQATTGLHMFPPSRTLCPVYPRPPMQIGDFMYLHPDCFEGNDGSDSDDKEEDKEEESDEGDKEAGAKDHLPAYATKKSKRHKVGMPLVFPSVSLGTVEPFSTPARGWDQCVKAELSGTTRWSKVSAIPFH